MNDVTAKLQAHYARTFAAHGTSPKGVDWRDEETANIRLRQMLKVVEKPRACSLLDVGCGYGALLAMIQAENLPYRYSGVDVVPAMIEAAKARFKDADFHCADIFSLDTQYDYVVCNGVLTQKLDASEPEMDAFAWRLIRHMFALSRVGIAFNIMTTHVNYTVPNLYYRDPQKMLADCISSITPHARLSENYGLYEYTLYLYR
jgi:SAM-dependent methyltransferase